MKGKGKDNGKMRGSLRCAVHDETVNCSGRDDGYLRLDWGEQATAKTATVKATTAKVTTVAGKFAKFTTATSPMGGGSNLCR
jgi:hypothetical protein